MNATGSPAAQIEAVVRLADEIGGAMAARGRSSTTLACERTILRLFEVSGLDRAGVPLASAVIERFIADDQARLAEGIALPFAMALREYDVAPRQLALDVASGAVDLALEARLLAEPARRAAAETEVRRLLDRAAERIVANRVARLELLTYFGEAPRPWRAARLAAPAIDRALEEVPALVAGGADLVRVTVPAVRELLARRRDLGLDGHAWLPRARPTDPEQPGEIPAGSQRGLARLRVRLDEAAAEAGRYVRLASSTDALAAPEQALVAALERVDLVEADPIAEIVAGGVDPDRALADHAFAHRLLRRAGVMIVVGPGPLAVAPDLAQGVPSSAGARAGRAFALQAVGIAIARADGLDLRALAAGALPAWLADERDPVAQTLAAVAVRRLAWPELALVFEEPATTVRAAARWPHLLACGLGVDGPSLAVERPGNLAADRALGEGTRAAVEVGRELPASTAEVLARPAVGDHVSALLGVALTTLERLDAEGWSSILAAGPGGPGRARLGADAVADRAGPDPLHGLFEAAG